MDQSIELSPEVYEALRRAAQASGVSPSEWIASKLEIPTRSAERPTVELFAALLGVIDSREEPKSQVRRTPLGELIARKLEGQGLSRPK